MKINSLLHTKETHIGIKGELQRIICLQLLSVHIQLPGVLKYPENVIFTVKYTVNIWRHVISRIICEDCVVLRFLELSISKMCYLC